MDLPIGRGPRAARVAATVFVAGLPAALVSYFADPATHSDVPIVRVLLTGLAVASLGVTLLMVPWGRLPSRAILVVAPLATVAAILGDVSDHYMRQSTLGLTLTLIVLPL